MTAPRAKRRDYTSEGYRAWLAGLAERLEAVTRLDELPSITRAVRAVSRAEPVPEADRFPAATERAER